MINDEKRLEALLSTPVLSAPLVSPDGMQVAWSWSRIGPAADVFATRTDGEGDPVRLTDTPDDTFVVSWTPDGEAVVVEQDHDGDERVQLSLVRLANPGIMEPLTEPSPNYYIRGGQVHKDGIWLVYGANLDPESDEEIEPTWILRHDLTTGERKVLARPEKGGPYPQPQLNSLGDFVLYHRKEKHPSGVQAWLVGIGGDGDREILNFGERAKVSASWLPDGRRIIFVAEGDSHRRLGVWNLEDESVVWLLDDPARNVEYAFAPPFGAGGPVVAVETERARVRATLLHPDGGVEDRLPEIPGNLVPLAPADEGEWIGLRYDARHPADLVKFTPANPETSTSLTDLQERMLIGTDDLAPAEEFVWESVDGLEVRGWLYRVESGNAGTIILVHGGPTSHSEDSFNAEVQYFVSRGFNVLSPNYRGSTGFGLAFQESIKEDGWGGREQEDIRAGIEALIQNGIAEPGRVGVTGTSYGGYSAWWAITHFPPEIVAAAAPICGMTDLVVDYDETRPDLRLYSEEMMGGSPEEVPERYRERSPIHHVQDIRGKLLIVQGLKDPNVTPGNVDAVVEELGRRDIPYELLTFEDEGHGIARPENLKVLYPRLADFFEKSIMGS